MVIKYSGKDIFKCPVNIPPEVKFDKDEFYRKLIELMKQYGINQLEVKP